MTGGMPALDIVNDVLLGGMKVVGELFGSGQMQLPFVLQSAETMKAAVAHLEPHMEKVGGSSSKGRLVLATVKGDVHDIGKNLVDIICTNNGYEVHNLGIKVPIGEMVAKVKEVDADAIGMSGLLVKSTLIMRDNLEELNNLGLSELPVLLGGAALTRRYVERDLREIYEGRLFYGRDAFEGLSTLDTIMGMKRSGEWDPDFGRVPTGRELPARSSSAGCAHGRAAPPLARRGDRQRGVRAAVRRVACHQGHRARRDRRVRQRDRAVPQPVAVPAREGRVREAGERRRVQGAHPRDVPVDAVGRPRRPACSCRSSCTGTSRPTATATTSSCGPTRPARPRRPGSTTPASRWRRSCASPTSSGPIESGEVDYAAFHIVTMGAAVSEATAELFAANEYQRYLLLHGLGVEMAEALAEHWHHRIREEWGFVGEDGPTIGGLFRQQYRGGRYSWGYPACPDLEDNATVARLLGADRLGIEVSEETGWQYQPEQTTSAIICHHPQAKYFIAR